MVIILFLADEQVGHGWVNEGVEHSAVMTRLLLQSPLFVMTGVNGSNELLQEKHQTVVTPATRGSRQEGTGGAGNETVGDRLAFIDVN